MFFNCLSSLFSSVNYMQENNFASSFLFLSSDFPLFKHSTMFKIEFCDVKEVNLKPLFLYLEYRSW